MPQLDLSNYFNLIFWSLVTFSLMYFTVSKKFCEKIEGIIKKRQNKIEHHLNGVDDFVSRRRMVEQKIRLLESSFNKQINQIKKHDEAQMVAAEMRVKTNFAESAAKLEQDYKISKANIIRDFGERLDPQKREIDTLVSNYFFR